MNTKQNLETARVEANRPSPANETGGLSWQQWMDLLTWDEMNAIAYETKFRLEDIGGLPCFDESKADVFNEAIDKARMARLSPQDGKGLTDSRENKKQTNP